MASGSDDGCMKETVEVFHKYCSYSDQEKEVPVLYHSDEDGWRDAEDRPNDSDNDDAADAHLDLPPPLEGGDRVYHPEDDRTGTLTFPDSHHDESYLVLECEDYTDEEPVKSKPPKRSRCSQPSSNDTDTTDSSGVAGAKQARPKKSSSKAKTDPPSDATAFGDDDDSETISGATNTVIHNATSQFDEPQINLTKTILIKIPHKTFCKGVTRWPKSPKEFPIQIGRALCFPKHGVKIFHLKLHCRGLAQDYDQRFATLEAVICFSPKSGACRRLLGLYDCSITLAVDVYRDEVHPDKKIGTETATITRTITSDERTQYMIGIVVNRVVNLDEIVYHDVCPEAIVLRVTATLEARLIQVSAADSGADAFVEISTSLEN